MVEDLIFKRYEADIFDVRSKVDVFFTRLLDEETLTSRWKEIRNCVALNQLDLDDEFERWNFYLFYVVDNKAIDINLKYEIEHDTISSRKMVVNATTVDDELCDMLIKKYILYVYNHEILVPDINSNVPYFDMSIPYMIGIDVAAGGEGDNTTLCIVHPYTLQIVGEIISPYMGILDLMRVIAQLAKMLPKCIFCVETNNCGKAIVDFVQESQLESRFYFDPKLDLTKNVTEKDNVDLSLKRKAKNKKYIGTYVTPKVRHNMFELLIMYVKEYRHLLLAKYLVKDIGNLVKDKSGKIAAADGEHDDMVMAYLHVLYVLNYGYDLTRFGIDKTLCTYEKGKRIVDEYENHEIN